MRYSKIARSKTGASQMYFFDGPAVSERRSVVRKKEKYQVSTFSLWNSDFGDLFRLFSKMAIPTATKTSRLYATRVEQSW
jgi:hypothetical protein